MARSEQAIFTNMCIIYSEDYILVQDRQNPGWQELHFLEDMLNMVNSRRNYYK